MNISTINTVVGMQSIQQKIDTIANNISNINTIGYKSREVFFHDILSGRLEQPEEFELQNRLTPNGLNQMGGTKAAMTLANFIQGQPIDTGIATDMLLIGKDLFFKLQPSGSENSYSEEAFRYTRDGHFQLDGSRYLVTDQGDYVLNSDDEPIQIPEGATFQVDYQGRITVQYTDGETEEYGYLGLTKMRDPQALENVGGNQFQIPRAIIESEIEFAQMLDMEEPENQGLYQVIQGSLENSNVDLAKEMTQLTEAQRAYQFMARGLSINEQMMGITNNLRG